jgi:hypothetical protein
VKLVEDPPPSGVNPSVGMTAATPRFWTTTDSERCPY